MLSVLQSVHKACVAHCDCPCVMFALAAPPVAVDNTYGQAKSGDTIIPTSRGILGNDSVPCGANAKVTLKQGPSQGTILAISDTGSFTYRPSTFPDPPTKDDFFVYTVDCGGLVCVAPGAPDLQGQNIYFGAADPLSPMRSLPWPLEPLLNQGPSQATSPTGWLSCLCWPPCTVCAFIKAGMMQHQRHLHSLKPALLFVACRRLMLQFTSQPLHVSCVASSQQKMMHVCATSCCSHMHIMQEHTHNSRVLH